MAALKVFSVSHGGIRIKVRLLPTVADVHREHQAVARRCHDGNTVCAFFLPTPRATRYVGTITLPLQGKLREAGSLELPLQSHNLLLAVMAKQINKSETRKEQQHEDRLAGRTPVGGSDVGRAMPDAAGETRPTTTPSAPRQIMPATVKAALKGVAHAND